MLLQDPALTPWNKPFLFRNVQSERGWDTVRSAALFASPVSPKAPSTSFSCFLSRKHTERRVAGILTTIGVIRGCVLRMEEVCLPFHAVVLHKGKNCQKMIAWWPNSLLENAWRMHALPSWTVLILNDPGLGTASMLFLPPRLSSMQQNRVLNDECTYASEICIYSSMIYKYITAAIDFPPC